MAVCSNETFPSVQSEEADLLFVKAVSEVVVNIEKDLLTYDNGNANNTDLKNVELKIQSDRILYVLDVAVEKFETAFCLPFIAKDWNGTDATAEQVVLANICQKLSKNVTNADESGLFDDKQLKGVMTGCINSVYEQKYHNAVPEYIKQIPETAHNFIDLMRDLRSVAELRIAMTAPKEMAKEKVLHKMWTDNEKIHENVKELQAEIISNDFKLQIQLDERNSKLNKLQVTRNQLNKENKHNIEREIKSSNREMHKNYIDSRQRQNEQLAEMTLVKEEYQALLESNLKADKKLRQEKMTVVQKLQSWIAKYDNDVGDRNQLLFQLTGDLEMANQTLVQWQRNFNDQDVVYNTMMSEKEEEENRIRDEKMILFMMNRAAAVIQRAWRKMLKARKGKKKKGKKKK